MKLTVEFQNPFREEFFRFFDFSLWWGNYRGFNLTVTVTILNLDFNLQLGAHG